jgi:hypothetical protein
MFMMNDHREQRRRSRLFNIIDPKDELKVKTLTNTVHPIKRKKNEETFFLFSLSCLE